MKLITWVLFSFCVLNPFTPYLNAQAERNKPYWVHPKGEKKIRRSPTNYTIKHRPERLFQLPRDLRETSGLAYFNNSLFTHNDSNHQPLIYALKPDDGNLLQTIRLKYGVNIDWEELAIDENYLYVGDFGNNSGERREFQVYRIKRSNIPLSGDTTLPVDTISFVYPDQPSNLKSQAHNFDCEAMVATSDALIIFSKNWADGHTWLYKLPKTPGKHSALLMDKFNSRGLITGADLEAESGILALVGYTNLTWKPFAWIFFHFEGDDFFSGEAVRIKFRKIQARQVEAVVFVQRDQLIITSEATKIATAQAYQINLSGLLPHLTDTTIVPQRNCMDLLNISSTELGLELKFYQKPKNPFLLMSESDARVPVHKWFIAPIQSKNSILRVPIKSSEPIPAYIRLITRDYHTRCPIL